MHPVSQLLLRNQPVLAHSGHRVWINPPGDLPRDLSKDDPVFCQDQADYVNLKNCGHCAEFGVLPIDHPETVNSIVLSLPREKERLLMMAHFCASFLAQDGELWVAGENRSGIKSSPRHLQKHFAEVEKIDSARHCVLLRCSKPIVSDVFVLSDYEMQLGIQVNDDSFKTSSLPGVFGRSSLDPGTRLLLENLPGFSDNLNVLDLACGSGVVGTYLLRNHPGFELTFSDTSALALRSTENTLALNELSGNVIPSDGFSQIEGRFDLVITNPPFHRGHRSNTDLSPGIFQPLRNFLNPGGQLIMVANQHLPYHEFLREVLSNHKILAADNHYKLYQGFL